MYLPKQFEETDIDVLHQLIRTKPLSTLVTLSSEGIAADHVPLLLTTEGQHYGTLRGHIAKANTLWQEHPADKDVLVIFNGAESYITPAWYASKSESGKAVPTWNYVSVQAKGKLRVIHEPDWILSQLEILTAQNEASFAHPWAMADSPDEFTHKLLDMIVGIEIKITDLKGKWKVSQNRPDQDRASVANGLANAGHYEMAAIIKSRVKGSGK